MFTFPTCKKKKKIQLKGVKVQVDAPAVAQNPALYSTFESVQSTGNVSDLMDRISFHDFPSAQESSGQSPC